MYKNGLTQCQRVDGLMLVKVKLSRSLEKRLVFPATTLSGFFWTVIHWVSISDSLPWSRPSLLGLAAGVVRPHRCEGERRGMGRAGLRTAVERGRAGRVGVAPGGGEGGGAEVGGKGER